MNGSGAPRVLGSHYSPRPVVARVVQQTLGTLLRQKRWSPSGELPVICDPACGAGVFLESALALLRTWYHRRRGRRPSGSTVTRLHRCLCGADVDPEAVRAARRALPGASIIEGNSLLAPERAPPHRLPVDFARAFPEAAEGGKFDVVVGNPPFVDAEEMTRSDPELRQLLAASFETARGNWDLFCVFIERAVSLLSDDGRLGLIVPNKLLAADYARRTRELLAALDLELLRDYSRVSLFDASVYPLVLVARRKPRRRPLLRLEVVQGTIEAPRVTSRATASRQQVAHAAADGWSSLFEAAPRCTATDTLRPLGELASITGAATVAEAYQLKPLIREGATRRAGYRLVNTGTLDPYAPLWGRRACRYLGERFERPWVDARALRGLLPAREEQARADKLLVGGLSQRLECLVDDGRLLAGKSTSVIRLPEPRPLWFLLGVLNSAVASRVYRRQFGGLSLSGGYLRIGPPQLRRLPVPDPDRLTGRQVRAISNAAARLSVMGAADCEALKSEEAAGLIAAIDEQAAALYGWDPP